MKTKETNHKNKKLAKIKHFGLLNKMKNYLLKNNNNNNKKE